MTTEHEKSEEEELQEELHHLDDEIQAAKDRMEAESHDHDETFIGGTDDESDAEPPG